MSMVQTFTNFYQPLHESRKGLKIKKQPRNEIALW